MTYQRHNVGNLKWRYYSQGVGYRILFPLDFKLLAHACPVPEPLLYLELRLPTTIDNIQLIIQTGNDDRHSLPVSIPKEFLLKLSRDWSSKLMKNAVILGEVLLQVIPHLRFVLMFLMTIPSPVCDRKRPTALEHNSNGSLGYLHRRGSPVTRR